MGGDTTHAVWYSQVRREVHHTYCLDIDQMDFCKGCKRPLIVWEYTRNGGDKETGVCRTLARELARAVPVILVIALDYMPQVTKFTDDVLSDVHIWEPQDLARRSPTHQVRVDRAGYLGLVAGMRIKWACPRPECQGQPAPAIQSPTALTIATDRSVVVHSNVASELPVEPTVPVSALEVHDCTCGVDGVSRTGTFTCTPCSRAQ